MKFDTRPTTKRAIEKHDILAAKVEGGCQEYVLRAYALRN